MEEEATTSRSYAEEEDEGADERAYQKELAAEIAGVPFSKSKAKAESDSEEEEEEDTGPTSMPVKLSKQALKDSVTKRTMEKEDGALMLDSLMPRKRKTLYQATQIGKARKQANVDEIVARKALLEAKEKAAQSPARSTRSSKK